MEGKSLLKLKEANATIRDMEEKYRVLHAMYTITEDRLKRANERIQQLEGKHLMATEHKPKYMDLDD
ncbi:hypothetical protein ACN6MY_03595 [Peribacillus sp. B-H-3]|uniref:hypothetical protein n=1 Tax=Peribacillus sp. B-H-3 TaxID=3400420 RepID=UPI003B016D8B